MAVSPPAAGLQVNFDVTGPGSRSAELHDGTAKIGSTFAIEEAWMQNADGFAGESAE